MELYQKKCASFSLHQHLCKVTQSIINNSALHSLQIVILIFRVTKSKIEITNMENRNKNFSVLALPLFRRKQTLTFMNFAGDHHFEEGFHKKTFFVAITE